jgi:hypothetical protein
MVAVLFLFHNTVPDVIYGNGWYYFRWLRSVPLYVVGFYWKKYSMFVLLGAMDVKIRDLRQYGLK